VSAREAQTSPVVGFPFVGFVTGSFAFGWLLGLLAVLRIWHLAQAPRWMMFTGVGYVSLMLAPAIIGFGFTRGMGRLAARGWGSGSLVMFATGLGGLVAGLYLR
jgi:hypothetical protein